MKRRGIRELQRSAVPDYRIHPCVLPFGPARSCSDYKYLPWYLPLQGQLKLFKFIPDEFVDPIEFSAFHFIRAARPSAHEGSGEKQGSRVEEKQRRRPPALLQASAFCPSGRTSCVQIRSLRICRRSGFLYRSDVLYIAISLSSSQYIIVIPVHHRHPCTSSSSL